MPNAQEIIDHYLLEPLDQEGGFFRRIWRSPMRIQNLDIEGDYPTSGERSMGTIIHFLLTSESFSAMHRLPTPEHWFYHLGDPAEMLLLHPGGESELLQLGPDLQAGQRVHVRTPVKSWQGTRLTPGFEQGFFFGSCVMVPGFEWTDFELGDADSLCSSFPAQEAAIRARSYPHPVEGAR